MTGGPGGGGVVVRPAAAGDVVRLVELLAHGAVGASQEQPSQPAPYLAALAEIGRGPGALLVAEREGEVVGVCQLIVFRHFQGRGGLCAEIESVHVHPDRRGHGIGHILMAAVIARARELGCYRVQLTSNTARTDAHRFYESLGFVPSHCGFKLVLD